MPDVIWITDENENTTFISDNVKIVYGFTPEEIYDNHENLWTGRIHPDDLDMIKTSFQNLMENNEKFETEYRIQRKDGTWIWLHDRGLQKYDENGTMHVYGIFTDITERKKVEIALKDSQERLQLAIEANGLGLWEYYFQEGRILHDEKWANKLGYGFKFETFDV